MGSFREAPIPPCAVLVEFDGCNAHDVDLAVYPSAAGTYEQCVGFIARYDPPRGGEFGILHIDSGRQMSFEYMKIRGKRPVIPMSALVPHK